MALKGEVSVISIDLLGSNPSHLENLAYIWQETLGKVWVPDVTISQCMARFSMHMSEDSLPITYVAFDQKKSVAMASLRENDGIRPDLTPWLGSLVVDPDCQGKGLGKMLVEKVKSEAKARGFDKLYLFTLDEHIPSYYKKLGWEIIGDDEYLGHPAIVMSINL